MTGRHFVVYGLVINPQIKSILLFWLVSRCVTTLNTSRHKLKCIDMDCVCTVPSATNFPDPECFVLIPHRRHPIHLPPPR